MNPISAETLRNLTSTTVVYSFAKRAWLNTVFDMVISAARDRKTEVTVNGSIFGSDSVADVSGMFSGVTVALVRPDIRISWAPPLPTVDVNQLREKVNVFKQHEEANADAIHAEWLAKQRATAQTLAANGRTHLVICATGTVFPVERVLADLKATFPNCRVSQIGATMCDVSWE